MNEDKKDARDLRQKINFRQIYKFLFTRTQYKVPRQLQVIKTISKPNIQPRQDFVDQTTL